MLGLQRRVGNRAVQRLVGGEGRPLPGGLRTSMERAFGADLGDVRVHEGARAAAVDAVACARGADLHFAPGEYQPDTAYGRALLGHELTHVLQQRAGRVAGGGVDPDARLEREAHEAGLAAARGEAVHLPDGPATPAAAGAGSAPPVQRTPKKLKRLLRYLGLMAQPPVGGGGAAPVATPLDEFVTAYESSRYYHGTHSPTTAQSIHDHGLLNFEDRAANLPGGQVSGMSRIDVAFKGDEKLGVYLGNRDFMTMARETIGGPKVRAYLPASRAVFHDAFDDDEIAQVPAHQLRPDPKFRGGGLITKDSIPAANMLHGTVTDLLDAQDPASAARVSSILGAVATHYTGAAPDEQAMIALLRQAVLQRRLSNAPLDR